MAHDIQDTQVFVVGGGPAGLAAALAARQAGFAVTVADCSHPPINKACGEGIMPDGLEALQRLGIRLHPAQVAAFTGIRFVNGDQRVEAAFASGVGYGIRRTLLHQEMVNAAERAGVTLLWDRRVSGIGDGEVRLDGDRIHCRWIIGADGQNSHVRRLSGLDRARCQRLRFGFRQHFAIAPWSRHVEVHWSDIGQMYVTPVSKDEVCVAFISPRKNIRFGEALSHFPALASRLREKFPTERVQGAITASRRLYKVHRGNVALVGEAAGSVDAITGEGLAISFQQAIALADALQAEDLSLYQSAHHRILRLPRTMAGLMLNLDRHPARRRRLFGALQQRPHIFARMLAIHTGAVSPVRFGVGSTLSLGWQLLKAKS